MKMNYTKTIREYCKTTPWKIFDVSYEMKDHFKMVPYKTLLKALNRLEEEGLLETVSKGVYLIKTGEPVADLILAENLLTREQLDVILDPWNLTKPGISGKELLKK